MKIAVATTNYVSVSEHFGRSAGFVIFELDGESVCRRELRTNHHTPHAQGLCDGEQGHGHGQGHSGIVEVLKDCAMVLCGGMGGGAAQALQQSGIEPRRVACPCSIEQAIAQYLKSETQHSELQPCNCGH